jgi:hypothetical protein
MPAPMPDFMHLDLTRLTWAGWLLLLLTLGVVAGACVGIMLALWALGVVTEPGKHRGVAAVVLIVSLGAGGGFFAGGRRLLQGAGLPILRPAKRR